MRLCDVEVVRLDGQRSQHIADVARARSTLPAAGQLDAEEQLGGGHGGYGDIVVVVDEGVERGAAPLRVDEDRRVDDQAVQRRSSI